MNDIGIYVHIPFCSSKCAYCSFVSTVNLSLQKQFLDKLTAEIAASEYGGEVTSVYIGGGTPSILKPGFLTEIFTEIRKKFAVNDNSEITVEANPDSATDEFLSECVQNGVNRISIGLQCADDEILKSIGRRHTVSDFVSAVNRAKKHGIDNVSADLMLGLENETDEKIIKSLEFILGLNINHISVYSLSVEKGCIMFTKNYRPDEDVMADQYELVSDYLQSRGYERYEISNFAKNGAYSRHNLKYWTHKPYVGFGPAAHSFFGGSRRANTNKVSDYLKGITVVSEEKISTSELEEEFIMLRLRLSEGLSLGEYTRLFGKNFESGRDKKLKKLYDARVIEKKDDRIFVTDKGTYILNYIITELI